MRHNCEAYSVSRWAEEDYRQLRQLRDMTPVRAMERAIQLRHQHRAFGLGTITRFYLDNPFATEDAHKVMVNDAKRFEPTERAAALRREADKRRRNRVTRRA